MGGPAMVQDFEALRALKKRRADQPKQIDNSGLYAGSPMYFYCRLCGHLSDVKPESYRDTPKHYCGPCQEIKTAYPDKPDKTIIGESESV